MSHWRAAAPNLYTLGRSWRSRVVEKLACWSQPVDFIHACNAMFAFFGFPGFFELLIIGLILAMVVGLPVIVVVVILLLHRSRARQDDDDHV
jgi:hypothetical protein